MGFLWEVLGRETLFLRGLLRWGDRGLVLLVTILPPDALGMTPAQKTEGPRVHIIFKQNPKCYRGPHRKPDLENHTLAVSGPQLWPGQRHRTQGRKHSGYWKSIFFQERGLVPSFHDKWLSGFLHLACITGSVNVAISED